MVPSTAENSWIRKEIAASWSSKDIPSIRWCKCWTCSNKLLLLDLKTQQIFHEIKILWDVHSSWSQMAHIDPSTPQSIKGVSVSTLLCECQFLTQIPIFSCLFGDSVIVLSRAPTPIRLNFTFLIVHKLYISYFKLS